MLLGLNISWRPKTFSFLSSDPRRKAGDQKRDVAKVLHPKVQACYEEYLRVHRPVLVKNLGDSAKYEPVFTDEEHGEGASRCFTLFPGYWPHSRLHAFTDNAFKTCIGALEQQTRRLMICACTPDLQRQRNVAKDALSQPFHHSEKVHKTGYSPLRARVQWRSSRTERRALFYSVSRLLETYAPPQLHRQQFQKLFGSPGVQSPGADD